MQSIMHPSGSVATPAAHLHSHHAGRWVYSGAITAYTKDFAMKRLISSLAALVAVACLVSACGQKGPLYLPDDSKSPEDQAKSSQPHKHY
jgi:predicted small lipoprotein YifL